MNNNLFDDFDYDNVMPGGEDACGLDDMYGCGDLYDGWDYTPDWEEESGWNDVYGSDVEASDIIDLGD